MKKNNIFEQVLNVSIPVISEMTLYTFMCVFDLMMIGNYGGNKALSAVGLSNSVIYTSCNIFVSVGFSVSVTSLVARSVGSRDYNKAEQYATCGFFLSDAVALIICLIMFKFAKTILYTAGARKEILVIGIKFIKITCVAVFFKMNTEIINSVLRGYGNTKTPFIISIVISSLKIALDFMLIFGYGFKEYGIIGAAIASVVSQSIGFLGAFFYIILKSKIRFRIKHMILFNINRAKEILALFVPAAIEEGLYSVSKLVSGFMIMTGGSIAFASDEIANTVESIALVPSMAFGVATTAIVGMRFGERNYKKARNSVKACNLCALGISLIFSIIFIFMPNVLVSLFVNKGEKKVVFISGLCLAIAAIEQPFIAISTIYEAGLDGMGDTKSPCFVTLISSWFIRVPLIYYFICKLKYPVTYVWWITAFQWIIDCILIYLVFKNRFRKLSS